MTYTADNVTSDAIARASRAEMIEDARMLRSSLWSNLLDRTGEAMCNPDDPEAKAAQRRAEAAYLQQVQHLAAMVVRHERATGLRRPNGRKL